MDLEHLDVEVGFPVDKLLAASGDMVPVIIPSGLKAVCLYKGPYSDMEPFYNEVFKWLEERGYQLNGAAYEYYLNSPDEVDISELLTRIVLCVGQKAKGDQ